MKLKESISEKEFLKQYDSKNYEKPSVAVDLLIFTIVEERLKIFMIKRQKHPCKNMAALPGVFVGMDETLEEAANRGLYEKAGLKGIYLEQLYTWGDVKRDPRMRIISVSYMALVPFRLLEQEARKEVLSENLYDVENILSDGEETAFDHKKMISYGRERIKNKVEYTEVAFEFMQDTFTLPQLQKTYEILLGKELYKANFRKKIQDMVEETGEMLSQGAYRPSKVYRRRK